jgi:hypothetical protein
MGLGNVSTLEIRAGMNVMGSHRNLMGVETIEL